MRPHPVNRRQILGAAASVPAAVLPAAAFANGYPDANLLAPGAEFATAFEMMDAAADRVEQFVRRRMGKQRMREAEGELERLTEVADAAASAILRMPARTPAGLFVKIRVNEVWPGTFEDEELLKSISADINAIAGAAS